MKVYLYKLHKGAQSYNSDYRHLEETDYVATAMMERTESMIMDEDSLDESADFTHRAEIVELAEGATDEDIKEALYRNASKSCSCEHDCCGHWFGSARLITKEDDTHWIVKSHYARNY